MTQECNCCGRTADTRMGYCWECVECEAVIAGGLDMYDKEIPKYKGMSSSMNKLKYVLNQYGVGAKKVKPNNS